MGYDIVDRPNKQFSLEEALHLFEQKCMKRFQSKQITTINKTQQN